MTMSPTHRTLRVAFVCALLLPGAALARPPVAKTTPEVAAHNAALLADLGAAISDPSTAGRVRWRHIVIHHTANEWSSLERIDRYHREKFEDPDGIEYHFLIGNGRKRPAGYIEPARWRIQKRAIHLFKPEGAPDAIAVSLVGNLHERRIGEAQYRAVRDLVVALARRHGIPVEGITSHTRVDGRLTVCPGKHFPFDRLIADVRAALQSDTDRWMNSSPAGSSAPAPPAPGR